MSTWRCIRSVGVVQVLMLITMGSSWAERRNEVSISTEPSSVEVFLGDESGPLLGTTPLKQRLAVGTHTILMRKAGFVDRFETIVVGRSGAARRYKFSLEKTHHGEVQVALVGDGSGLAGVAVFVDGTEIELDDQGVARVTSGPHQVEVVKRGHSPFEAWVDVAPGGRVEVEAELSRDDQEAIPADEPDDRDRVAVEPDDLDEAGTQQRAPSFELSVGPEFLFRKYAYQRPLTENLRPYSASGVPLVRVAGQWHPLSYTGNSFLRGFGVKANYATIALPLESATSSGMSIKTETSEYFLGGVFRAEFAGKFVAVEGGVGRQRYQFVPEMDNAGLRDEVPDVDYHYQRFGAAAGFVHGRWLTRLGAHTHIVSSMGELERRFSSVRVTAYGGEIETAVEFAKHWSVRFWGNYDRYEHEFVPSVDYEAEGGLDQYVALQVALTFQR